MKRKTLQEAGAAYAAAVIEVGRAHEKHDAANKALGAAYMALVASQEKLTSAKADLLAVASVVAA